MNRRLSGLFTALGLVVALTGATAAHAEEGCDMQLQALNAIHLPGPVTHVLADAANVGTGHCESDSEFVITVDGEEYVRYHFAAAVAPGENIHTQRTLDGANPTGFTQFSVVSPEDLNPTNNGHGLTPPDSWERGDNVVFADGFEDGTTGAWSSSVGEEEPNNPAL